MIQNAKLERNEPLSPLVTQTADCAVTYTNHCAFSAPLEDLTFAHRVRRELVAIGDMLIAKNQAYGNSALDPVRIFSKADTVEQIKVRIDDKLSRLKRGLAADTAMADTEDVIRDLMGYLVLLRLAQQNRDEAAPFPSQP